jgi:DNA-binding beta-propeller fold protein YncE
VACYQSPSCVAVIDLAARKVRKMIRTGRGTCGLTMTNDERYVIASNDQDDSISVIDTKTDEVIRIPSARPGFEKLGITGYIQGISIGRNDEVYVYGCSGNGALVRFEDITSSPRWTISYPGGKLSSI